MFYFDQPQCRHSLPFSSEPNRQIRGGVFPERLHLPQRNLAAYALWSPSKITKTQKIYCFSSSEINDKISTWVRLNPHRTTWFRAPKWGKISIVTYNWRCFFKELLMHFNTVKRIKNLDEDELRRIVGCVYEFKPSKTLQINALFNKHISFFSRCTFWADPRLSSQKN